jgi:hypothetical protein
LDHSSFAIAKYQGKYAGVPLQTYVEAHDSRSVDAGYQLPAARMLRCCHDTRYTIVGDVFALYDESQKFGNTEDNISPSLAAIFQYY